MSEIVTSLRKFREEDIPNKIKWVNNPDNNMFLHYDLPLVYDKTLNWYENIKDSSERHDFVIECNGTAVGLIGLLSIDQDNMKAEYYIMLGEAAYKGKGVATSASRLLLDYAFSVLDLKKVYLMTEEKNIFAQKLFEKIGFSREGLFIPEIRKNGESNRYIYSITGDRFKNEIRSARNPN